MQVLEFAIKRALSEREARRERSELYGREYDQEKNNIQRHILSTNRSCQRCKY